MIIDRRLIALMLVGSCTATAVFAQVRPNPFSAPSTLQFQAPRFDIITDGDYQPAFEAAMKQELAEIKAIANDPRAPTFDNTIVAMEKMGRMLDRVNATFTAVIQANSNPTLEQVQTREAPKLAAQQDAIVLNSKLFARVKSIYEQRRALQLDPESLQLLTITYEQFVHAGANLSDQNKERLKYLNQHIAKLSTSFRQKLVAATKAAALVVSDKALLAGLSDDAMANAAQAARQRGLTGKWLIPLQNTTQQPLLTELSNRATRKQLFDHRWSATEKGDANDTRQIVARLAQLRAEQATLLGFPNYATSVLYDQMAKTPEAVLGFLGQLVPPTAAKAADEAKLIQAAIDHSGMHFDLKPWDWQRYGDQVQRQRYDLDENELKPYFELHSVLENGVFYAAQQLYGLSFKRRTDIPVYQNDVMVYEVFDANKSSLGLAYFDYFMRDNKEGGAWMENFVGQSQLLGTRPVIYNVANFTKPASGRSAYISLDDVITMFHEFGHGLHALLANGKYPSLAGTHVARDFVEFPSQFNEHWALYPAVLKHYAINQATGQVIPDSLVEKIKRARTWGQGYQIGELLAAAELDMKWHMLPGTAALQDVDAFETAALKATHTDFENVPPRYRSSYFQHIWGDEYAAGYYAYQWTAMLADDAFAWFAAHGGLTRANGQRFRDLILSRGHSEEYDTMFRTFYGKDPDVGPMLENRGLTLN
jgi:peptidyl-dipeptidase Dcp